MRNNDNNTNEMVRYIEENARLDGINAFVFYTTLGNNYYTKTDIIICSNDNIQSTNDIKEYFDNKSVISKKQYFDVKNNHNPFSMLESTINIFGKGLLSSSTSISSALTALINVHININFGFILIIYNRTVKYGKLSGNLLSSILEYHQYLSNVKLVEINKVFFNTLPTSPNLSQEKEENNVNIIISWVMELIKKIIYYDYGVVGIIDDNKKIFEVVNLVGFDNDLNTWFRSVAPNKYTQMKKWINNTISDDIQLINPEEFKPPIENADVKHFLVIKLTSNELGRTGLLILASKITSHFILIKENKTLEYLLLSLSNILKYIFSLHYNKTLSSKESIIAPVFQNIIYRNKKEAIFSIDTSTLSKNMAKLYNTTDKIKNGLGNILITGETGVGKGFLAEYIHYTCDRKDKPFITIDCASIPDQLLESELFGHKKGSFTGAVANNMGKIEAGQMGTIFLDEIGEMNLDLQKKMLKFLDTRTIIPVGSNVPVNVNVRVIAATNRELEEDVKKGVFRKDLYHRLNIFSLLIPPLRERKDEIPILAYNILKQLNKLYNMNIANINDNAMSQLMEYSWPGNVRELFNTIEKSYFLHANDKSIIDIDIPIYRKPATSGNNNDIIPVISEIDNESMEYIKQKMDKLEYEQIDSVLKKTFGNIAAASKILGINRKTLFLKMRQYDLKKEVYKVK